MTVLESKRPFTVIVKLYSLYETMDLGFQICDYFTQTT